MDRIVVVGASLAGLRAAQAARAAGFGGEIVMVGDEPHRPYTRPPLSKELLAGEQRAEQCALPGAERLDLRWRLGSAATSLERPARRVILADGDSIGYERLIIATGCRARRWRGPGDGLAGVHTLRSLDDALALRGALRPGARLIIVGAGFIGCEVAASARGLGAEVTVLDIAPHPMLPLGPELGARCARMHADRGVTIHCGTGIAAVEGDDRVRSVTLTDGSALETDLVLMALGAEPNTDWLAGSGLDTSSGLVCDATLTAVGDPDILAAGDLAAWPHPLACGRLVRVEHWTTAAEHGQLAGRNILLEPEDRAAHVAPPYFWSDQYDTKIQAVGFPVLADRLEIVEEEPETGRLVATGHRDGRLVAAVAFNNARRLTEYRRQLAAPPVGAAG